MEEERFEKEEERSAYFKTALADSIKKADRSLQMVKLLAEKMGADESEAPEEEQKESAIGGGKKKGKKGGQ